MRKSKFFALAGVVAGAAFLLADANTAKADWGVSVRFGHSRHYRCPRNVYVPSYSYCYPRAYYVPYHHFGYRD